MIPTAARHRLRMEVRSLVSTSPLYLKYLKRKRSMAGLDKQPYWDMGLVEPESDLLIEAFWRSGNTFAFAAAQLAMGRDARIAHHACAPAQLRLAGRWRVPALVIARPPEATIASALRWSATYSPAQWTRAYCRYYEGVGRNLEWTLVASFASVVTDFGSVMQAVNERFGCQLAVFQHSPANVARAYALIEENDRLRFNAINEDQVSRPSDVRARAKDAYVAAYHSVSPDLKRRAETAFSHVSSAAR